MPTSYSTNLKFSLPATGELSGTWGTVTNTNIGTLIEEATVGAATVAMADANQTITITDGASSTGRAVYIQCTGALTAGRNLTVPTVNKNYIVENATTGGFDVTVKTAAGTGIAVKPGTKRAVYVDATNVVEAINGLGATTISGALTYGGVALSNSVTGTGSMVLSTSPTLVTPALGTPASGVLSNCTGFPTATGSTTFLTADATTAVAGTYVNGPTTGSIGANGQIWLISANAVYVNSFGNNMTASIRINSGATDVGDTSASAATGFSLSMSIAPIVITLTAATTFTLQATDNIGGNQGALKATTIASGTNKATWITAIRLA